MPRMTDNPTPLQQALACVDELDLDDLRVLISEAVARRESLDAAVRATYRRGDYVYFEPRRRGYGRVYGRVERVLTKNLEVVVVDESTRQPRPGLRRWRVRPSMCTRWE